MNQRNAHLELWRFLFCMAVLGFHFFIPRNSLLFRGGYLGVEFFLIVSGYFLASHYQSHFADLSVKKKLTSIPPFLLSRLIRLYPLYLISLVFMLLIRSFVTGNGFSTLMDLLRTSWAEFFLLQWSPLGNEVLISAHWFVPAIVFGSLFYLLIYFAFTPKYAPFVSLLISLLLYSYYYQKIAKIDVIFSYHSILRGIAGMGLGIFVYYLTQRMQNRLKGTFLTFLPHALFLSIFVYLNFGHRGKMDFVIIAGYAFALFLMFSKETPFDPRFEKLFCTLGKATYAIYILQMPLIELIQLVWPVQ